MIKWFIWIVTTSLVPFLSGHIFPFIYPQSQSVIHFQVLIVGVTLNHCTVSLLVSHLLASPPPCLLETPHWHLYLGSCVFSSYPMEESRNPQPGLSEPVSVLSHPFLLCDSPVYVPAQTRLCMLCSVSAPLAPRPSFIKCFDHVITPLLVCVPHVL